ncbi:MAG TPA: N-formylglutamate amidohydrolase [Steroidobacteraceae bacterium]|nr:N-formylglutamate amidohydrolase [Steroidobacteraceae bacterium]
MRSGQSLLAPDEPAAFQVEREQGRSPFLLTCDHASARVPRRLNSLGVSAQDLRRHIAWDIGAAAVATRLATRLDAFLILQNWSRLVIDCNRPPGSPQSIVPLSEATRIPGNESISPDEALAREMEIFRPYHDRIAAELDQRQAQERPTILISMHSFTPILHGRARPWHAGLLYNRDPRLAEALLPILRADADLVVGDNEPYAVSDSTDYTIPVYGERRGLLHVGIELRQDLIADEAGQNQWSERLAQALLTACERFA